MAIKLVKQPLVPTPKNMGEIATWIEEQSPKIHDTLWIGITMYNNLIVESLKANEFDIDISETPDIFRIEKNVAIKAPPLKERSAKGVNQSKAMKRYWQKRKRLEASAALQAKAEADLKQPAPEGEVVSQWPPVESRFATPQLLLDEDRKSA
jgi:hypothetical protein